MSGLLACPFCRGLYGRRETGGRCPDCGVELVGLERLPPSLEALAEDALHGELGHPDDRPLPWSHLGRARGPLLALAVLGLCAFTAPWVELTSPHRESLSGYLLARRGAGWLWGGAAAWFVLAPLVLSRRTIRQMRGVRAIVTLFAAMTAMEILVLVALPPRGHPLVRYEYHWGVGLVASALVSVVATGFGFRFGGRPSAEPEPHGGPPPVAAEERAPPGTPLH